MRFHRTDFAGPIEKPQRTPQGGLSVPANLTRAGVLRYRDTDGREWGELRHPDDVFAADSLATLRGAPVVDLHPTTPVTSENFKALSVGHVRDDVAPSGDFVAGGVVVQDAEEVRRVEAGERREVSCGYTCTIDATPGVWNGERYDQRQREIRYNHVGLGPAGWGRAGSEVSLRMDGAAVQVRRDAAEESNLKNKLKVMGREFKLDAEDDVAAAQGAVDDQTATIDTMAAKLQAAEEALKAAIGEIAALKAKIDAEEKSEATPVTEEEVPEAVADAICAKRLALVDEARRFVTDSKESAALVSLPARKVRELVIGKVSPTVKCDGLSDAVVEGMYRMAVSGGVSRNDALGNAHAAAFDPTRNDGDEDPAATSRADTTARWQKPLAMNAARS